MSPEARLDRTPPKERYEVLMIGQMREVLPKAFPVLMNRDKWTPSWGISRPWPTPTRRGEPAGGHFGGVLNKRVVKARAADIYLDAKKPYERRLGQLLFEAFIRRRAQLGIQFVVWNEQQSTGEKVKAYPENADKCDYAVGNPAEMKSCLHKDHLHVEFRADVGDLDIRAPLGQIVTEVTKALSTPAK
jgi:hypothetical protein